MFLFFRLIEQIGSQDVSNVIWKVFLLCVEDGFNQESEVRDRREISRESEFSHIIRLCAGTHGENAALAKARALSILTVSDSMVTGEKTTAEERETSFADMIHVALEIV